MQDVASISAMQHFHFGQRIRCSDGEAGLLTQVVFDAASIGCYVGGDDSFSGGSRGTSGWIENYLKDREKRS